MNTKKTNKRRAAMRRAARARKRWPPLPTPQLQDAEPQMTQQEQQQFLQTSHEFRDVYEFTYEQEVLTQYNQQALLMAQQQAQMMAMGQVQQTQVMQQLPHQMPDGTFQTFPVTPGTSIWVVPLSQQPLQEQMLMAQQHFINTQNRLQQMQMQNGEYFLD